MTDTYSIPLRICNGLHGMIRQQKKLENWAAVVDVVGL